MPHFKLLEDLEMPQFSYFQNQMGAFQRFQTIESGAFRGKGIQTEKGPKLKSFDFGTFQK